MTNPTNWPNPNRPGAPMFPDREGWHVMEGICGGQTALTHWNGREWGGGEQVRSLNTSPERYRYVGAVYTPAQVSALLAAERGRCVSACLSQKEIFGSPEYAGGPCGAVMERFACDRCIEEIRNLGAAS